MKKTILGEQLSLLAKLEPGVSMFIDREPKTITAYEKLLNIKLKTEQVLIIEGKRKPTIKKITKVIRI